MSTTTSSLPRYDPSRRCCVCGCESPRSERCGECEIAQRLTDEHETAIAEKDAEIAKLREELAQAYDALVCPDGGDYGTHRCIRCDSEVG